MSKNKDQFNLSEVYLMKRTALFAALAALAVSASAADLRLFGANSQVGAVSGVASESSSSSLAASPISLTFGASQSSAINESLATANTSTDGQVVQSGSVGQTATATQSGSLGLFAGSVSEANAAQVGGAFATGNYQTIGLGVVLP